MYKNNLLSSSSDSTGFEPGLIWFYNEKINFNFFFSTNFLVSKQNKKNGFLFVIRYFDLTHQGEGNSKKFCTLPGVTF